ncbi:MAG: type I methionyl aminopeptidase [Clostridia bacterium]|nr:type I methionyl aminopeptidase [Clostridia bacterium]
MISVKTDSEIAKMRVANGIVRDVLKLLEEHVKEGVSTAYLDKIAREYIEKQGATPSFLGYNGFPASICASVDDVVVHGIPSKHIVLKEGQIVGLDVGACIHGFHGDAARTFAVGRISPEKQRLMDVTKECFFKGVSVMKDGVRLGDLSNAIQEHAESNGYSVVRELVGHGIGRAMHEDPSVPNYGPAGHGVRMHANMTIAVEPMINMGGKEVYTARDGWTVRTVDGKPSAHYENTILITQEGVEILTL